MTDDPFELALLDVLGRRVDVEQLRAVELLGKRVAFYELTPFLGVPMAAPTPSIVRPGANTEAVSSSPASKASDRRGTGTR